MHDAAEGAGHAHRPATAATAARPVALDDYALCADFDPSAPAAAEPAADAGLIRVYCRQCNTLMYATPAQVGSQLICPDCRTATPVPPPRAKPADPAAAKFRVALTEQYDLQDPSGGPPRPREFGFKCARCGSRLHAGVDQVGAAVVCPDCGESMPVPAPPAPPRKPQPQPQPGDYGVGRSGPLPEFKPIFVTRGGRTQRRRDDAGPTPSDLDYAPQVPPRRPMLSGVFGFPWSAGCLSRWIGLSVAAALFGNFGLAALHSADSIPGGYGGIGPALVAITAWAGTLFLGACLCLIVAVLCLAILSDTAAGNRQVVNWPNLSAFIDWFGSTFFVFNALLVSALPGFGVDWLLGWLGRPSGFATPLSAFVLFPPLLLSMLDNDSPLSPLSWGVCASLRSHFAAWAAFYVESTLVLAVAAGTVAATLPAESPLLTFAVGGAAASAALMIYFRLLGRLAWCCSERTAPR